MKLTIYRHKTTDNRRPFTISYNNIYYGFFESLISIEEARQKVLYMPDSLIGISGPQAERTFGPLELISEEEV